MLASNWLTLAKHYEKLTVAGSIPTTLPASAITDAQYFEVCVAYSPEHIICSQAQPAVFTIQSISKLLVLYYILDNYGSLDTVAMHPTTIAYNETDPALFMADQKIVNPFINAGALTLVSMIEGVTMQHKVERVMAFIAQKFGITTQVDEAIYAYERTHSQTNEAICHTLAALGFLQADVATTLASYLRLCALQMTTCDLAKISYLLQQQRTTDKNIALIEQALLACGLYGASPLTVNEQPIAAKSGVSGSIIAYSALPEAHSLAKIGVGIYSPLLNNEGNSAKGYQFLQQLFALTTEEAY